MNNTIFDDVFRTIVEKMPQLVVPLINEVFHMAYPYDTEIVQLRNEYQDESGEMITDSCLQIGGRIYHIECESRDDATMAVRMIEYDLRIALGRARRVGRKYYIEFPRSCVLYLRSTSKTPDVLEVEVKMPDGTRCPYQIPTVKMGDYDKEELFAKDLQMLLPFYAMKYEKMGEILEKDPDRLEAVKKEFTEIRKTLEERSMERGSLDLYTDLSALTVKIIRYIFREKERVREEIGGVMGGKVLELESERLRREGWEKGIAAMVQDNLEEGVGEERILEKLQRRFSLDRERAEGYYRRYSGL